MSDHGDSPWRRIVYRGLACAATVMIVCAGWVTVDLLRQDVQAPAHAQSSATVGGTGVQVAEAGSTEDVAASSSTGPALRADPAWVATTAAATGIPERALFAYAAADLVIDREQPECGIGWNTIAGIGYVESAHASHGNSMLKADGWVEPRILGPQLDGDGVAAITDTDGGAWDGDSIWDRAVGPMQFIPDTWYRWGADGNGDGAADPNQLDDAALATARYLCASGSMTTNAGWRGAVFSYNHLDSYVTAVADAANEYARRAQSVR